MDLYYYPEDEECPKNLPADCFVWEFVKDINRQAAVFIHRRTKQLKVVKEAFINKDTNLIVL